MPRVNVDPLRHTVHANHECPLRGRDDAGRRHEQRLWTSDRPLHLWIHAGGQSQIRVLDVNSAAMLLVFSSRSCAEIDTPADVSPDRRGQ